MPKIQIGDKSLSRQPSKLSKTNSILTTLIENQAAPSGISIENVDWNYRFDSNCEDLLVFSQDAREILYQLEPVRRGALIFQDKPISLAVIATKNIAHEQSDILLVNDVSGYTALHLLSVLQNTAFDGRVLICNVFVNELAIKQIQDNLEQFGMNGK